MAEHEMNAGCEQRFINAEEKFRDIYRKFEGVEKRTENLPLMSRLVEQMIESNKETALVQKEFGKVITEMGTTLYKINFNMEALSGSVSKLNEEFDDLRTAPAYPNQALVDTLLSDKKVTNDIRVIAAQEKVVTSQEKLKIIGLTIGLIGSIILSVIGFLT